MGSIKFNSFILNKFSYSGILTALIALPLLFIAVYFSSEDFHIWASVLPDFYILFFSGIFIGLIFCALFLNLRAKYLNLLKAESSIKHNKLFLRKVIDANPNLI